MLIAHRYQFEVIVFSTLLKLHCQLNSDMPSVVCLPCHLEVNYLLHISPLVTSVVLLLQTYHNS